MQLDGGHKDFEEHRRLKRPVARVINVAKATTDTELTGIRMAATMGERFPVMAKLIRIFPNCMSFTIVSKLFCKQSYNFTIFEIINSKTS